jgi:hypothetical protein
MRRRGHLRASATVLLPVGLVRTASMRTGLDRLQWRAQTSVQLVDGASSAGWSIIGPLRYVRTVNRALLDAADVLGLPGLIERLGDAARDRDLEVHPLRTARGHDDQRDEQESGR